MANNSSVQERGNRKKGEERKSANNDKQPVKLYIAGMNNWMRKVYKMLVKRMNNVPQTAVRMQNKPYPCKHRKREKLQIKNGKLVTPEIILIDEQSTSKTPWEGSLNHLVDGN